jgi:hypothetical protein
MCGGGLLHDVLMNCVVAQMAANMQQSLQTSLTSIQALADEPAKASEAPSIFCSMLDGLNSVFDTDLFGLFSIDAFTQTVDNLDLDKYSGRWYQACGFLPSCRLGELRGMMLYCCCSSIQSESLSLILVLDCICGIAVSVCPTYRMHLPIFSEEFQLHVHR